MNLIPSSFFNLNSTRNRALISGASIASFYGWVQYTSPDSISSILDVNSLAANPLNPIILVPPVVAASGVFLPKLLRIKIPSIGHLKIGGNKQKTSQVDTTNKQYNESGASIIEFAKGQDSSEMSSQKDTLSNSILKEAAPPMAKSLASSITQTSKEASSSQPNVVAVTNDQPQINPGTMIPSQDSNNELKLSEIIESKTARMTEDVESVKKDMGSLRDDIQTLKTDIKDLTSTFESSLVELKAFQSEMVNPVNFMRKYFEMLDIKNVSDPANAMMQMENMVNANAADIRQVTKSSDAPEHQKYLKSDDLANNQNPEMKVSSHPEMEGRAHVIRNTSRDIDDFSPEEIYDMLKRQRAASRDADDTEYDDEEFIDRKNLRRDDELRDSDSALARSRMKRKNIVSKKSTTLFGDANTEVIRSSIENGLTPGKIMSVVSIVDEILASMGPDGVELVLEQYRAIGLKPQEERLIYGIVKMLNESKLLTDDIIAMLYRFGQVLGINDNDAELQYMKIVANKHSNKKKRTSRDIMTSKGEE